MPLKNRVGWTIATLGSIFLGASLLYDSYSAFGIGLAIFCALAFLMIKGIL